MVSASILMDSVAKDGARLTTFELKLPKYLLAQLNTHRAFSKNTASSRAIPTKKLVKMALEDPVVPISFGKNRPGMQAEGEVDAEQALALWMRGRDAAIDVALQLAELGLHKQHANRVLEPYIHASVILSATEYDNFFKLRCHHAAQPEMQALACAMRDARAASTPKERTQHIPMVDEEDFDRLDARLRLGDVRVPEEIAKNFSNGSIGAGLWLASAGRCARISYLTHTGVRDIGEDVRLALDLIRDGHWSPFEHQAVAYPGRNANFIGWVQLRKGLEA